MTKSAFTDAHRMMVQVLRKARKDSGRDQAVIAAMLGKDQSFISNIERGQRRVDLIEFIVLCRVVDANPIDILKEILEFMPENIDI